MVVGCFETMCCISKFTPIEFAEPDMYKKPVAVSKTHAHFKVHL